jgi:AcrR family transcriptional regulator
MPRRQVTPASPAAGPRRRARTSAGGPRPTPLSQLLDAAGKPARKTALDAFALARKKWLAGERLDIGQLAEELGVGRGTVFRWVGSREQHYGEVLSSLFQALLARARREATGGGPGYVADVVHRLLQALIEAAPLRTFVRRDPEFAMRVITSRDSPTARRNTAALAQLLADEVAAGRLEPAMDIDDLAYVIVRITESFLYRDVITGGAPDIGKAEQAIGILLAARPPAAAPSKARPRRS